MSMKVNNRERIVEMVAEAFESNPRAQAMMKKKDPARSVRLMTEYAYDLMESMDGIYLSDDNSTVLFWYIKSKYRRSLADYLRYGRLFFRAIRISQVIPTLRREKLIASLRPDYSDYIYVWVLGSEQGSTSVKGLAEINSFLNRKSEELQIPVLIETTVEKMLKLYNYVGFDTYHEWFDEKAGLPVWFLERKHKPVKSEKV